MNIRSLVVGGLLAAASTPLWALTPNQVANTDRLYLGGATATTNVLGRLFIAPVADGGGCAAGTIHVYSAGVDDNTKTARQRVAIAFSSTGAAGNKGYAVLCTGANGLSGNIGMFKETNGGSGNGVAPVFNGTNLNYVAIGNAATVPNCTGPVAIPADGTVSQAFTLYHSCGGTPLATPPLAGISDVEPVRLATGPAALGLTPTGIVSIVFAPAVTLGLYRAMQTVSGIAPQDDDPSRVPSFTSGEFRSLLSGKILAWSRLKSDSGAAGLAPTDPTVYVCRRGNSSGTEKSFEILALNQGCTGGNVAVATMLPPDTSSCEASGCTWSDVTYGADVVFAGTSSDDVVACLNYHQAQGHYAVGTLSTESEPVSFRYAGLNRANPDLVSAASGNYEFWTESTFNTGGAGDTNASTGQAAIRTWVKGHFGLPAAVAAVNEGLRWAQGDGGLLAVPNPGTIDPPTLPLTVGKLRTNPTNLAFRAPNNNKVNNCQFPVVRGSYPLELGGEGQTTPTGAAIADYN